MSCSSPDAKLEDIKDSSENYTLKVEMKMHQNSLIKLTRRMTNMQIS